ncbi:MAG: GntR family transcriptional regulator [Lachnospiraceae bacterium]|nr:GntR family transcriptional regulator [Lachnospiraceae bacterium]MBR1876291.1 GntR family transcriptional regulator [Lachnospiraceae bacterium]
MFIDIDLRDRKPLYEQIALGIEDQIMRGLIQPDEALPSVRSLAMELSINPNTVQKAYGALEQKGLIYSVSGRGSFASNAEGLLPGKREDILKQLDEIITKAVKFGISMDELLERARNAGNIGNT